MDENGKVAELPTAEIENQTPKMWKPFKKRGPLVKLFHTFTEYCLSKSNMMAVTLWVGVHAVSHHAFSIKRNVLFVGILERLNRIRRVWQVLNEYNDCFS